MLQKNPHLKFANADKRGYVTMAIGAQGGDIRLRAVGDVTDKDTGIADLARFAIENGRPGAQRS